MMHPGKPDGTRVLTIGTLAMIGIVLLLDGDALAQRTNPYAAGIVGFRELRWGASVEEATRIYPDLYLERYVISESREAPWKVYVRKTEHEELESVTFDSIEYWFREDRFFQIRAVLRSRIGPRTLVTPAENAFDRIRQRLRGRYGNPSDQHVGYLTELIVVVREATWIAGQSAITIKYEGAGKTDEDVLTLTMRQKPKR